jgi:transcriptional regulator with XRE-family HTH domain
VTAWELKKARKQSKWTQNKLAQKLGVSQAFVALVESGKRKLPSQLARKAVRLMNMSPTMLPVTKDPFSLAGESFAEQLGALGYPGFRHLRSVRKRNPVEVLLSALAQEHLEVRVTEALPWLLLQYTNVSEMHKQWLLEQSRLRCLTNRLGFVVTLAKQVAGRSGDTTSERYQTLTKLEEELRQSRLEREDTLCQADMTENEREWLRQTRPQHAAEWHLLTDWRPEHLQYAA